MSGPEFLERDVVLFLHDQALREYGGAQGLRDDGLLDSALSRPVNKFACEGPMVRLVDLAAAYAFGIARDHPFQDGNKRTAWGCCVLFLKINDVAVALEAADVVCRMLDLVERRLDETGFTAWLLPRSGPGPGRHQGRVPRTRAPKLEPR